MVLASGAVIYWRDNDDTQNILKSVMCESFGVFDTEPSEKTVETVGKDGQVHTLHKIYLWWRTYLECLEITGLQISIHCV